LTAIPTSHPVTAAPIDQEQVMFVALFTEGDLALVSLMEQELLRADIQETVGEVAGTDPSFVFVDFKRGSIIVDTTVSFTNISAAEPFRNTVIRGKTDQSIVSAMFSETVRNQFRGLPIISLEAIEDSNNSGGGGGDNFAIIAAVVVVLVVVLGAVAGGVVFCCLRHVNNAAEKKSVEDSDHDIEMQGALLYAKAEKLPFSIDVFTTLNKQGAKQWNDELRDFLAKIQTVDGVRGALMKHGRTWKAHLFRFLSTKLSSVADFEVVDETTGDPVSMKMKFVALAVTVLSTIDLGDCLPETPIRKESTKLWRLRESFGLIKEACKFGPAVQERSVRSLLLYTLVNKLGNVLFPQGSSGMQTPSLASEKWDRIIALVDEVLKAVLIEHPNYDFILEEREGRYSALRLISATRNLLTNKSAMGAIEDNSVYEMKGFSSRTEKRKIDTRVDTLRNHSHLLQALCDFMVETTKMVQESKKRRHRSAISSSVEADAPKLHISVAAELRDSKANEIINRTATLLAEGTKRCKTVESARTALLFSVEKLEHSQNMAAVQTLASAALGSPNSRLLSGWGRRGGRSELRTLLRPQIRELDSQIVARNCVNDQMGVYHVRLSGVPVSLRVLHANHLPARVKSGLLMHQRLSTSPFIVQMFGVGHSARHGWFVALEYLERTLLDIITAWPPLDLDQRAKIATDIARGFEYLHKAGIYHRDIQPLSILVTNTFQIKIADFSLSEEISGMTNTLKTLQTSTTLSSTGTQPLYMAPERHVQVELKSSAKDSARADVFSTGAMLVELLSNSRQKLEHVLPRDVCSHYTQRAHSAGIDLTRRHDTESDLKKSETKAALARSLSVRFAGDVEDSNKVIPAFELKSFELDQALLPILTKGIALDPMERPSMTELKVQLMKARKVIEERSELKEIRYLNKQQVAEIDKSLVIANIVQGTRNVYKVTLFGGLVAVKVLGSVKFSGKLRDEVLILQATSDYPLVVKMFGVGYSERFGWFLCMEYVPNSLEGLSFRTPLLPLPLRVQMATDMAKGFSFLHQMGIFHRDIKPLNVLVTNEFQIRICDFGISKAMKTNDRETDGRAHTVKKMKRMIFGTSTFRKPP